MSIHPSLSSSTVGQKQRSVLKRIERIKVLMEKGLWKEPNPIFGLPKIKTIRIKIKKEKAAKAVEGIVPAEGAVPIPTGTVATEAKPKATEPPAKAPSSKASKDKS